ncbi:MAG TPA: energy transducer TonB [Acidobacteriaceae bacterium]
MRFRPGHPFFLLLLAVVLPSALHAQNSAADISTRFAGKTVFLRGFWTADKLKFDASGDPEGTPAAGSPMVAGLNVDKVSIGVHGLRMEGQRVGVAFDRDGVRTTIPLHGPTPLWKKAKPERVSIEIEGKDGDDFGPALNAIFAMDFTEFAAILPTAWQVYAHSHFGKDATAPAGGNKPRRTGNGEVAHVGGAVVAPKVTHSVDPEFSEVARRMKYSGTVEVYFWVEEDGTMSHVRVARPAGMGLDEVAVQAVQQYRFQPATREGQPVKVDLYIEVKFQIF